MNTGWEKIVASVLPQVSLLGMLAMGLWLLLLREFLGFRPAVLATACGARVARSVESLFPSRPDDGGGRPAPPPFPLPRHPHRLPDHFGSRHARFVKVPS